MKNKRQTPAYASIQVIDRAFKLLDVIASSAPISLKVVAVETGLHTSTAFRILASLEQHGFIDRDEAGRYRLGAKPLQLASQVRETLEIRQESRPVLDWVRSQLHETVNLTVRQGDEVVYVERAAGSKMMRVEHVIGSRAPLHVTAVGKLFLGEAGPQACLEYAARTGLPALTPNTITEVERLEREAATAVQQGYALDDEEAEIGVSCIAAPVRDASGTMVAALSVSAPAGRRQPEWVATVQAGYAPQAVRLAGATQSA